MPSLLYLVRKVRERGIIWCVRTTIKYYLTWRHRIRGQIGLKLQQIFIRPVLIIPSLRFLFRRDVHLDRRILAIWDFRTSPYSIGDMLYFNEVTMIQRLIHKVDKVDICLTFDSTNTSPSAVNIIRADDNYYHVSTLLPVVTTNPNLGSFYIFDSQERLEAFLMANVDRYHIFPPLKEYLNKFPSSASNFNFINKFYRKNGFIPYLSCQPNIIKWACTFINRNVEPYFPVVVHLRNQQLFTERNARLDCWLEFFKYCNGKFNVKFVLIGAMEETDDRFRQFPNVVVAKDFGTTVVQDLALIQTSLLFLGVSSGPNIMAIFSDTPYVIFNFTPYTESDIPYGSKPAFATDLQKMAWEPENTDMLIREFSELYSKINLSEWKTKHLGRLKET